MGMTSSATLADAVPGVIATARRKRLKTNRRNILAGAGRMGHLHRSVGVPCRLRCDADTPLQKGGDTQTCGVGAFL